MSEERWARYRHRKRLDIEYDVRESNALSGEFWAKLHALENEACVRVRTIRNHSFVEEVHQPAFTLMPAEFFSMSIGELRGRAWAR